MRSIRVAVASLSAVVLASEGRAQPVASLPFLNGQTAGMRAQLYNPPMLDRDIWLIEDFSITAPVLLDEFQSKGTVFPAVYAGGVEDVVVQIWTDLPTLGTLVLQSVPGTGTFTPGPLGSTGDWRAKFNGQKLAAGTYRLVWAAKLPIPEAIPLFWHQPGPHAVGGGEPDNAILYNPGGFWNFPNPPYKQVPLELGGQAPPGTGANFVLTGSVDACYADCDASGGLNIDDFICFQTLYAIGDPFADCDADGQLNIDDFICFQTAYALGC
jgi:hypothetical protein